MTTELAERRDRSAMALLLAAGVAAVVAAITLTIDLRASRPDVASGPVVPQLAESIARAQRITVTSADASYRIERTQRGWAMRDRGDYAVLPGRLSQLTEGLEGLHYVRRMTSDPAKHERLGVGDPREGGRGVLVQIEDGSRALLVDLILGIEPDGGLYVRRSGQDQVWTARGELPPLRDVAAWLDLTPLEIDPATLARVEIVPAEGRAYVLARADADTPWAIVAPGRLTPLGQSLLTSTAQRLTSVSPIDVQEAPAIQGPARARIRALTFAGVAIDAELIESGGRSWLKLVARADTPAQEDGALAINNRAAAWAYGLSSSGAEALAPPLSALVPVE